MKALPVMRLFLFSALCVAVYGSHDHHNNHEDSYYSQSTPEIQNSEVSSDYTATPVLQYGWVERDGYVTYYEPNYALIISLPIVGLVILIACCVGIIKCCCGKGHTQPGLVIMQPNVIQPPPQPQQIIVQQPAYPSMHQSPPPPYQMQQPVQNYDPQQQQWAQPWQAKPQEQPQQYPKQGLDNPSFQ